MRGSTGPHSPCRAAWLIQEGCPEPLLSQAPTTRLLLLGLLSAGAQPHETPSSVDTFLGSPLSISGVWLLPQARPQTDLAQATTSQGARSVLQTPETLHCPPNLLSLASSWLSRPSQNQNSKPSKPYFRSSWGHFSYLSDFAPNGNPYSKTWANFLTHQPRVLLSQAGPGAEISPSGFSEHRTFSPPFSCSISLFLSPPFLSHSQTAGIN